MTSREEPRKPCQAFPRIPETDPVVCRRALSLRSNDGHPPIKVYLLTLSTGRLELWKEFSIPELGSPTDVFPAPDGKSYVYGYRKYAADLVIAEGLR